MPMTASQSSQKNIVNSLKDYLAANVVTPYNTAVASTNYPGQCSIGIAYPDDPDIYIGVPRIILEMPLMDLDVSGTGAGDHLVLRDKQAFMCVYPGVTSTGKPTIASMEKLMSLFDYALGSALYIPVYDYSVSPKSLVDCMEVRNPKVIHPRNRMDPTLGLERHRFDYQITLRYAHVAING